MSHLTIFPAKPQWGFWATFRLFWADCRRVLGLSPVCLNELFPSLSGASVSDVPGEGGFSYGFGGLHFFPSRGEAGGWILDL